VETAETCNATPAEVTYSATGRVGEIQIDSSSNTFVFPSQVGANVDLSANYRVFAQHADAVAQSTKYDYIFDLLLDQSNEAATFCTSFDVSGANAFNSGAHAVQTAELKSGSQAAMKAIIVRALTDGKITGSAQTGVTGAFLDPSGGAGEAAVDEKIDQVLTKVLNHWINGLADATFDTAYYDIALAGNTGLPDDVQSGDVDIALDSNSGNAVLAKDAAADNAVNLTNGVITADAHHLARQIPGSNLTLYADANGNLPRNLLLKGGDKVVLGFQVQMNNSQILTVSHNRSANATNSGEAFDTYPANLSVNTLAVDHAIRDITVAVRLAMPGSGAITGVGFSA
jgi:hypothetical protein